MQGVNAGEGSQKSRNVIAGFGTGSGKSTFWPDVRAHTKLRRIQRYGSRTAKVEVRQAMSYELSSSRALEAALEKRARRRRAKFVASLGAMLTGVMDGLQVRYDGLRLVRRGSPSLNK